jgi:hypothetical protein
MKLLLAPGLLAVTRLAPDAPFPAWAEGGPLVSVTRTADELSVVCPEARIPDGVRAERGYRALQVAGPLDVALTGILAALAPPLAQAGVPLLALGTFDTDWLLVPQARLAEGLTALRGAGHEIEG